MAAQNATVTTPANTTERRQIDGIRTEATNCDETGRDGHRNHEPDGTKRQELTDAQCSLQFPRKLFRNANRTHIAPDLISEYPNRYTRVASANVGAVFLPYDVGTADLPYKEMVSAIVFPVGRGGHRLELR